MSKFTGKTYWLIGASEGLGRALAQHLDAAGANLILSARNAGRLDELCSELKLARTLVLDVTDLKAVQDCAHILPEVDGVIYMAGAYNPMRGADWDQHAALAMCEVNFLGAMRVMGEVVPHFVKRGHGDITLIGSLAGYRGLPASVGYSASKAALISLAETLRFDLKDSGVTVRVVNPGFVKTRLTDKNSFKMPMLMTPVQAARHVIKAMQKNRFRTDFPAPFSWLIRLIDLLPDVLVYRGK